MPGLATAMPDLAPVSPKALRLLFQEQQRFLNFFFDKLEYGPLEDFCKVCLACKGSILFTGVGKSGFIAQKISQTLVSTGTKAVFLNPTDALHGDLGIVCEDDVVVCVSKSGATEELLRLVPYAKAKGALLVSVACLAETKLEAMCDLAVHLPLERELCPFDLAPVTSTAIQMLFGDTIAIALMQAKNLTEDQYAMNHPAGRIGKRLVLRVSDVMLASAAELPLVAPHDRVMAVLGELSSKGCGCVLVTDQPEEPSNGELATQDPGATAAQQANGFACEAAAPTAASVQPTCSVPGSQQQQHAGVTPQSQAAPEAGQSHCSLPPRGPEAVSPDQPPVASLQQVSHQQLTEARLRDAGILRRPSGSLSLSRSSSLGRVSSLGRACSLGRQRLIGTFTDGDLRRALQQRGGAVMDLRVADLMNPAPRTCASDLKAVDAMLAMEMPPRKVTFLPVVDDGHLVGLVTLHALVSAGL